MLRRAAAALGLVEEWERGSKVNDTSLAKERERETERSEGGTSMREGIVRGRKREWTKCMYPSSLSFHESWTIFMPPSQQHLPSPSSAASSSSWEKTRSPGIRHTKRREKERGTSYLHQVQQFNFFSSFQQQSRIQQHQKSHHTSRNK